MKNHTRPAGFGSKTEFITISWKLLPNRASHMRARSSRVKAKMPSDFGIWTRQHDTHEHPSGRRARWLGGFLPAQTRKRIGDRQPPRRTYRPRPWPACAAPPRCGLFVSAVTMPPSESTRAGNHDPVSHGITRAQQELNFRSGGMRPSPDAASRRKRSAPAATA